MRTIVAGLCLAIMTGCVQQPNTVPDPVTPTAAVQYYDLDIPADLEVKGADFSATAFLDVSGMNGTTSTSSSGRGFIKVFAVHRKTGEQYLLLYEDPANRRKPIQVIHFRQGD